MAIAFAFRSSVHETTNATTHVTTTAFTPAAHSLMLAVVRTTGKSATPTALQTTSATNRYTFAEVYNNASGTNYFGIWVADSGATPPNDTITATLTASNDTGGHISVTEITGADMSGTALNSIAQTETPVSLTAQTSGSMTLTSPLSANNRPLVCFVISNQQVSFTPRTNWTELDDANYASPADSMQVQCRSDAFETTCTCTWGGASLTVAAIGVEIKAASTGDTQFVGAIPI